MNRLYLVSFFVAALAAGCGKDVKKGPTAATGGSSSAGAAGQRDSDDDAPTKNALRDPVEYFPAALASAAGVRPGELSRTTMGKSAIRQLGLITSVLDRVGVPLDNVEHAWVGSMNNRTDLIVCVRTNSGLDPNSLKTKLGAASGKVGGHELRPIVDAPGNSVCMPDARTLLAGRTAAVESALHGGAGPAKTGYAVIGNGAAFWFAGDQRSAEAHLLGGSIPLLELDPSIAKGIRSIGVGMQFEDGVAMALAIEFGSGNDAKSGESAFQEAISRLKDGRSGDSDRKSGGVHGASPGRFGGNSPIQELVSAAIDPLAFPQQKDGDGADAANRPNDGEKKVGGAPKGQAEPVIEWSASNPEVQGSVMRLRLGFKTQIVPLNAVAVHALGGLMKGDGLFHGVLDSAGAAFQAVAGRTDRPLKGVRKADANSVVFGYSWMCELLPHLGYQDTYDRLNYQRSWTKDQNAMAQATKLVAEFLDPADRETRWRGYPFNDLALTHFVGMAGVEDSRNVSAAELPRSDPRAGVFGYDEVAGIDKIVDGAANTILMVGAGKLKGLWIQGGGATIRGARAPHFDPTTGFGSKSLNGKGALAVMADGSVREIAADVDPKIFNAMSTIAGGEKVDLPR